MQTYCWWWLFFWLFASLDVLQASKISVTKKWSLSVMRPADGGKTSILVHQPLFMTPCVNPVDALAAMPSVLLWHAVNNGNKENIKEPLCAHMSYFRCQKDYRWHFLTVVETLTALVEPLSCPLSYHHMKKLCFTCLKKKEIEAFACSFGPGLGITD